MAFPSAALLHLIPSRVALCRPGGVGFDISCGVRTMLTGLAVKGHHASPEIACGVPVPAGSSRRRQQRRPITLDTGEMDAMLTGGARWAIARGWGEMRDLERIEEEGAMIGAQPACVSERAKQRQRREMGTLGSGNHYLEVQAVAEIFDARVAKTFGLAEGGRVVHRHPLRVARTRPPDRHRVPEKRWW